MFLSGAGIHFYKAVKSKKGTKIKIIKTKNPLIVIQAIGGFLMFKKFVLD
ncbi:MAG: hypothetical protein LBV16_04645 [Elusimicrobiota bacterium]|jgi:hypothetical protein|nr:hypothetical protein [Elusimicrobiota bacterium]